MADAAAEIPRKRFLDFVFRGMSIFVKERLRRHQDSRSAESALKSRVINECLLQRIESACLRIPQSLYRRNVFSVTFDGKNFAGKHGFGIHEDGATSAGALATGGFRSCQAEIFPKSI